MLLRLQFFLVVKFVVLIETIRTQLLLGVVVHYECGMLILIEVLVYQFDSSAMYFG